MAGVVHSLVLSPPKSMPKSVLGSFSPSPFRRYPSRRGDFVGLLYGEGTGGWGIGNSREMLPEEFRNRGERRAFEGYQLSSRGDFMRQVEQDASSIIDDELDELMGVAKIAGINVKDPNTRLNKFGKDLLDDDDDLDLSVPLES
ncbi:hypothetical protein ACA910_022145 [Epithemia clementina (nom. ined.)]